MHIDIGPAQLRSLRRGKITVGTCHRESGNGLSTIVLHDFDIRVSAHCDGCPDEKRAAEVIKHELGHAQHGLEEHQGFWLDTPSNRKTDEIIADRYSKLF